MDILPFSLLRTGAHIYSCDLSVIHMRKYGGYQIIFFSFRRYDTLVMAPCLNYCNFGVNSNARLLDRKKFGINVIEELLLRRNFADHPL